MEYEPRDKKDIFEMIKTSTETKKVVRLLFNLGHAASLEHNPELWNESLADIHRELASRNISKDENSEIERRLKKIQNGLYAPETGFATILKNRHYRQGQQISIPGGLWQELISTDIFLRKLCVKYNLLDNSDPQVNLQG